MSTRMSSSFPAIGLLSSIVFVAACTPTVTGHKEASLDSTAEAEVIPRHSCTPANTSVATADGLLADFATKQGQVFAVVPKGYPATTQLSQTTEGGKLAVSVAATPDDRPRYLVATMPFDGCIDATGFAGVEFKLAGSLSGCSLQFAAVDPEHQYVRPDGPYPPQTRISEVTPEPRTIKAPFRNADIPGRPATPTDGSKLALVQWMVIVPVGSHDGSPVAPCTGSLVIDDVKLYR